MPNPIALCAAALCEIHKTDLNLLINIGITPLINILTSGIGLKIIRRESKGITGQAQ